MKSNPAAEVAIVSPRLDQAEEIMRLRATLFREELATAGVEPELVAAHTEGWDNRQSGLDFEESLQVWANHPDAYTVRVAEVNTRVRGLFVATHGGHPQENGRVTQGNELQIIQLAPEIRGVPRDASEQRASHRLMASYLLSGLQANPALPTWLQVLTANFRAQRFYLNWGFEYIAVGAMDICGKTVPTFLMQRPPQNVLANGGTV